jgi:putative addiction module component (TIGR02574 family)
MSVAADKIAEILALPESDRARLAAELIASLDTQVDAQAEAEWMDVIERRCRELDSGSVTTRSVEEVIRDIRTGLNARPKSS